MTRLVPFNRRGNLMNTGFEDFYNVLDDFFTGTPRRSLAADTFKIDLQEDEKNYFIEADLPGVNKDEVKVAIEDGKLNISVIREEKIDDQTKNYLHRERRFSSMQRSVYLADADAANIKAKLDNGVLTMTIPKKGEEDKSVKIEIE